MSTKLLSQPKHPNAINIDTGILDYAPLGSSKRERRLKLGLYFKYGRKDYILKYCLVPLPTH